MKTVNIIKNYPYFSHKSDNFNIWSPLATSFNTIYKLDKGSHHTVQLIEYKNLKLHSTTITNSIVTMFLVAKTLKRGHLLKTVTAIIVLHKESKLFAQIRN